MAKAAEFSASPVIYLTSSSRPRVVALIGRLRILPEIVYWHTMNPVLPSVAHQRNPQARLQKTHPKLITCDHGTSRSIEIRMLLPCNMADPMHRSELYVGQHDSLDLLLQGPLSMPRFTRTSHSTTLSCQSTSPLANDTRRPRDWSPGNHQRSGSRHIWPASRDHLWGHP